MTTRLLQKHLFKGTQEFKIVDDHIEVRIKAPFKKEETLTVMLSVLNSEPMIRRSSLDFNSRVNGEALISLFMENPNAKEFNAFVSTLKQMASDEYNTFTGLRPSAQSGAFAANVHEEPPEFDDSEQVEINQLMSNVHIDRLDEAIDMLEEYMNSADIEEFLNAVKGLRAEPESEQRMQQLVNAFHGLGPTQGAVLTYAPYISILLADDPFKR
ncbi:MAG: hypothetical protein HKP55_15190 [Gammaproteobacteria bacterium]|nr:hypothetical protein [Gammaproteobacteria bacterium]